jgi:hypothetical protein
MGDGAINRDGPIFGQSGLSLYPPTSSPTARLPSPCSKSNDNLPLMTPLMNAADRIKQHGHALIL